MIRMRWLILAFGTLLALAGRAGAQGPAVTAVNKAIQAQGGMAALERARAMSRKSSSSASPLSSCSLSIKSVLGRGSGLPCSSSKLRKMASRPCTKPSEPSAFFGRKPEM